MASRESLPDESQLGDQIESFSPAAANVLFLLMFSAGLIVGGVTVIWFELRGAYRANWQMPFYLEFGWSWSGFIGSWLIGFVLIGLGNALAIYANRLRSRSVRFYDHGFQYQQRNSVERVLWSNIDSVRETILQARAPSLKFPAILLAPSGASSSYTLITLAGKEFHFDANWVTDIVRFARFLQAEARRQSVPWDYADAQR